VRLASAAERLSGAEAVGNFASLKGALEAGCEHRQTRARIARLSVASFLVVSFGPPLSSIATILRPTCALEMASNGDVLTMLLLTALVGKQPESAPEIGFFSAPVDRETSVRWRLSTSISMT
jgi:hypothetical protein